MDEFEKFYNKALKFLSYRPRSEKEVRDRLKLKTQNLKVIDNVIQKLKEKNFINDEEFAKWWIESRNRFKPRSIRLIKLELKQKGITPEIIEEMINPARNASQSDAGGDEGLMLNDLENAKKLVEKRMTRFRNPTSLKLRGASKFGMTPKKLGRYLASKGFDWDTIKQVIDPVKN